MVRAPFTAKSLSGCVLASFSIPGPGLAYTPKFFCNRSPGKGQLNTEAVFLALRLVTITSGVPGLFESFRSFSRLHFF